MPLDPSLVPRWVEATYPLDGVRCAEVHDRGKNVLVRVEWATGAAWLRAAVGQRVPLAHADDEARMVAALWRSGLRVAPPIARRDAAGERYAAELPEGRGTALLFAEAPGEMAEVPTAARSEALGALVACIHRTSPPAGARPIDRAHLVDEPLRAVEPWLRAHGIDGAPWRRTADAMVEEVDRHGAWRDAVPCHGDVRFENARFSGDTPTLFDFELWGLGPAAYDLACFWRKDVESDGDRARASAVWSAFLRGYRRHRSIDDAALAAVPALATLRAIWTMAMPALPDARWGREWLEDRAYFEAHAGHVERYAAIARLP